MRQVLADLERHEAYRLFAYPDPLSPLHKSYPGLNWGFKPAKAILPAYSSWEKGKPWTVGIGYTIGVTVDSTQTHAEAVKVTTEEVERNIKDLTSIFPDWVNQPFVVQTVLVNMVYNMGAAKLAKFKNSLQYLKARDYQAAANNLQLSLWYKQTGDRAKELIKRVRTLTIEPEHLVN